MAMYPCLSLPSLSFPTLTGSIVTFNAQYALPLKSHTVAVNAVQASGTPSPATPLPISGWSALNINATNNNLFNGDYLAAMLARQGATVDTVNKTVTYTGAQARNAGVIVKGIFKANTQYTIFAKLAEDSEVTTINIRVVYTDSTSTQMNNYTKGSLDCKITSANKTIDYIEFAWITGPTKVYYDYFGCIEGALTVDDFISSNGTYKYIQIGSTVYGGEYDARTGVLTVTNKYFNISQVEYYGTYGSDNANLYYCTIPNYNTEVIEPLAKASDNGNIISNIFSQTTGNTVQGMANNEVRTTSANVPERFYFRADSFTDLTDFNTYLSNTPIQIVAKLATPQTIQLPPCPIDTIANSVNNIWADTGNSTIQYPKFG